MKLLGIFSLFALAAISCNNADNSATAKDDTVTVKPAAPVAETRADTAFKTQVPDDAAINSIKNYLQTTYLTKADLRAMDSTDKKFKAAALDLNQDKKPEYLVYLNSQYFCGSGGCSFVLLSNDFKKITNFTVTHPPVFITNEIVNGWEVLVVKSEGKWKKLHYANNTYPSNPTLVKDTLASSPENLYPSVFGDIDAMPQYTF